MYSEKFYFIVFSICLSIGLFLAFKPYDLINFSNNIKITSLIKIEEDLKIIKTKIIENSILEKLNMDSNLNSFTLIKYLENFETTPTYDSLKNSIKRKEKESQVFYSIYYDKNKNELLIKVNSLNDMINLQDINNEICNALNEKDKELRKNKYNCRINLNIN